jgi:beta-lactam-binding protein with PASTA domain
VSRPRHSSKRPTRLALIVAALLLALVAGSPAAGRTPPRRVVVPKVTRALDLRAAYARLAKAGLRMAIPQAFSLRSLCLPSARTQSPAAGKHVPRAATVTVGGLTCFLGSPAGGSQQAAVVPDFTGRTASSAVHWAESNQLYWELDRLPALRPSTRTTLLENYVVTSQRPAPGSLLARGMACPGVASGCFVATPLVMRARARR